MRVADLIEHGRLRRAAHPICALSCALLLAPHTARAQLPQLEAPFITRQPRSQIVSAGARAVLNVRAFGSPPLTCQWQFNHKDITGATNFTWVLNEFHSGLAGVYSARIANAAGSVFSKPAYVSLPPGLPVISMQPASQTADLGGRVTFQVQTTGPAPVRYQWRHNGVHLSGQTNASLVINDLETADGGTYTVEVASPVGVVRSQKALLRLALPLTETSDSFDSRLQLEKSGALRGSNRSSSHEQGEPNHAGKPGLHSVWFSWRAAETGIARFSTAGSTFDTLLAVYQGRDVSRLEEIAANDDGGEAHASEVRINVEEGQRYEIAVDGLTGASGEFVLTWGYEATEALLPAILEHPRSQTVPEGAGARLDVVVDPKDSLYQWFHNGRLIQGATRPTLSFPNVQPQHVGTYEVVVTQRTETVRSHPARLEIGPVPSAQTQDKIVDLLHGKSREILGGAGGGGGGVGGGFPSLPTAVPVTLGSIHSQIFDNTGDGAEEDELVHCHVISASSAWFALAPEQFGLMVLDTIGSSFDTLMAVYVGPAVDDPDFWLQVQLVACDYNSAPDGIRSQVSFLADAGTTYYVMVDGAGSSSGMAYLNWALVDPPVAKGKGQMLFLTVGMHVGLEPAGPASAGATWQWFHDGTLLAGQTNSRMYLCNLQLGNAGQYSLRETRLNISKTEVLFDLVVAQIEAQPNAPPRVLVRSTEPVVMESSPDQMKGWDWAAAVPGGVSFHYNETDRAILSERFYRVRLP